MCYRSKDPTCEVSELDDGTGVLIAVKDIHVGDWLTVYPSDEEDDNEGLDQG